MTPARRDNIARLATSVYSARDLIRGRTVPAIREGGSFDGRAIVAGDADGFRDAGDEEDMLEQRLFERDMWRDKGC